MKLWILGLGVCLFTAQELAAQYASRPHDARDILDTQRLMTLAREFSLRRVNPPTPSSPRLGEATVVSMHSLTHKIDKRARKLSERGMREYLHQHYGEVLPLLQKAVGIDPQAAALQNNLGIIYCALGKDEEAQQAFQRAIQIDSGAVISYTN